MEDCFLILGLMFALIGQRGGGGQRCDGVVRGKTNDAGASLKQEPPEIEATNPAATSPRENKGPRLRRRWRILSTLTANSECRCHRPRAREVTRRTSLFSARLVRQVA